MNRRGQGNGVLLVVASTMLLCVAWYFLVIQTPKEVGDIQPLLSSNILTNNLSIICVSGYSSTVRDVSESLKQEVYERDNITKSNETAIDHIISLCLGGSNVITNLRAMYVSEKVKKDNLERYLCNNKVCDGLIDINYAQRRMWEDWRSYYEEIYN